MPIVRTAYELLEKKQQLDNETFSYMSKLERDNATLKKGFRIFMEKMCLDEDGNTKVEFNQEEVDFLKMMVETTGI